MELNGKDTRTHIAANGKSKTKRQSWKERDATRGNPPTQKQIDIASKWLVSYTPDHLTHTSGTAYHLTLGDGQADAQILSVTPLFKQILEASLGTCSSFFPHRTPHHPTAIPELKDLAAHRPLNMFTTKRVAGKLCPLEKTESFLDEAKMQSRFLPHSNGWYSREYTYEGNAHGRESVLLMSARFDEQIPAFPTDVDELVDNPFLLFWNLMPYAFLKDSYINSNPSPTAAEHEECISLHDMVKVCIFMLERRGETSLWGTIQKPTRRGVISGSTWHKNMSYWKFNHHMAREGLDIEACGDTAGKSGDSAVNTGGVDLPSKPTMNDDDTTVPVDDDFEEQLGALSRTILRANLQYSAHMGASFSNFYCVVVDEVSVPWKSLLKLIHLVKSQSKVHRVAVEFKVLNCAHWGVRIAMIIVLSKEGSAVEASCTATRLVQHDLHNYHFRSSWYVVRLLCDAGLLDQKDKKPTICIADGAFASTILAAVLYRRYNIHLLGPVKVCSAYSHKDLTMGLSMPDQEGFVTQTKVNVMTQKFHSRPTQVDFDVFIAPNRHRVRGEGGKFATKAIAAPQTPTETTKKGQKKPTPAEQKKTKINNVSAWDVIVYQYVDGVQNLVTTIPQHNIHHHISYGNLKLLRKRLREGTSKGRAGFHCLTPRFLYRVLFNVCDVQNKSLRRMGAMKNYARRFESRYLQFLVDLVMDCAHRVYSIYNKSRDRAEYTAQQFRDCVISGAYKHFGESQDVGGLTRRHSERLEEEADTQAHMMSLMTTALGGFRKTAPGHNHKRNRLSQDMIMCETCNKHRAANGCVECSKRLPNQVFCQWCWYKHYDSTHRLL